MFFSFRVSAQPQVQYPLEITEMIKSYDSKATLDTQKLYLANKIAWALRSLDPSEAIKYSTEASLLANDFAEYEELSKAYNFTGLCHRNLENYGEALEYYQLGLQVAENHDNLKNQQAFSYVNIGNLYLLQGEYAQCQNNLFKALNLGRQLSDSSVLAYVYLNLGRSFIGQKKYAEAEDYLRKALEVRQKSLAPLNSQIAVMKYIGDVYSEKKEYNLAKQTYLKCFALNPQNTDYDLLSDMSVKISKVYLEAKMYDSAYYYSNSALKYAKILKSKTRIKTAYNAVAEVFYANGNYKEAAKNYYNQTLYNDSVFWEMLEQRQYNLKRTAEREVSQFRDTAVLYKEKSETQSIMIKFLLIIFPILILALVLFFRDKNKKLSNENLRIIADNQKIRSDLSKLETAFNKQTQSMKFSQMQLSDNISYAYNIQKMMLPELEKFGTFFSDKFVYYNPLDIVSGDFYWCFDNDNYQIIAVADCSGHDVKGSFLSLYGINALHDIASEGEFSAAKMLEKLKVRVKNLLYMIYPSDHDISADSMDIALIAIDKHTKMLEYSGSNIPMYYVREEQIYQLRQTKNSINLFSKDVPYEQQFLQLNTGDCIYMASDGYCSQFGYQVKYEFKIDFFEEMLLKIYKLDMSKQREMIEQKFLEWKGGENQNDDILVTGFRV